jgi:type II secretory pathway pseudopilin PulG
MMNLNALTKEKGGEALTSEARFSFQSGFSYVDMMIAVTIMLVGILAMLSAITSGSAMTATDQQQLIAKQYAQSTVEAIFSARDKNALGFSSIGNVDDLTIPGGIFLSGQQQFYPTAGPDGIIGTADDRAGRDGIIGTSDDVQPMEGFLQQIEITNMPDPDHPLAPIALRQVKVTIFYLIGGAQFSESATTFAANRRIDQP